MEIRNDYKKIFDVIEDALARAGYRLLEGDTDTLIIRDSSKDQDYEIKIETLD